MEILVAWWAMKKFNYFLSGQKFDFYTEKDFE